MTDRRLHLDSRAVTLLLVCCTIWGLQQIVVKASLPLMPPVMQAALRSAIAALLVWAWSAWRGIPLFGRDGTLAGGLMAGFLFAAEFLCIYVGLGYTAASRMVVLLYLAPFVVAAGMPFIARSERLAPGQVAGLVLGFAGVVVAFSEGLFGTAQGPAGRQWIGDALGVLAAVLWGSTTLVVRATRLSTASPEKTLFYQLAVSALMLGVASAWRGEAWPAAWPPALWGTMAFQGVIVAFASFLTWFWLMRHYPATQLSSFTFLTPLIGLCMGWLLLGEAITPQLVVAMAGVAAGIWLVNRRPAAAPAR